MNEAANLRVSKLRPSLPPSSHSEKDRARTEGEQARIRITSGGRQAGGTAADATAAPVVIRAHQPPAYLASRRVGREIEHAIAMTLSFHNDGTEL